MPASVNVSTPPITPAKLIQTATAFWASKALLSAVELGVFTELAKKPGTKEDLAKRLEIHTRGTADLLDCLVSLGFLQRDGAVYTNSEDAATYLDAAKPDYIGGFFNMMNTRTYTFWGNLTEALRTGRQQNEAKNDPELFAKLYSDPAGLRGFLEAMTGISRSTAKIIARKFDFSKYSTVMDIGCAQGGATIEVVTPHAGLQGFGYDLPVVGPLFEEYVAKYKMSDRVKFVGGDFFKEELPPADVMLMGHILHDWDLEEKMMLLKKAHKALPKGGALLVYDAMIDDDRRENTMGLLMSLNMLVETPGGFDYTTADCKKWMHDAGFADVSFVSLTPVHTMAVGIK